MECAFDLEFKIWNFMPYDPDNKVVQLCVDGMNVEAQGDIEKAKSLFKQAWDIAENDFEAFTAAHYVGRNQNTPEETLHWNEEALRLAQATAMDDVNAYYPSLYLNVAKAHEDLQNHAQAAKHYILAAESCSNLPQSNYGEMIKKGIAEGLKRVSNSIQIQSMVDGR